MCNHIRWKPSPEKLPTKVAMTVKPRIGATKLTPSDKRLIIGSGISPDRITVHQAFRLSKLKRLTQPNDNASQRVERIVSALPSRLLQKQASKSGTKLPNFKVFTRSPQDFVTSLLAAKGIKVDTQKHESLCDFFSNPTEQDIKAYNNDVIEAVRKNDVIALRHFHGEGRIMKCRNRFGDSLLHLACRSSANDALNFLINEAEVPPQVKDDYGRTPLHYAFWTSKPNFESADILITACPDLLYITDDRGHTPLSYVRSAHYDNWKGFFLRRKVETFMPKVLGKVKKDKVCYQGDVSAT